MKKSSKIMMASIVFLAVFALGLSGCASSKAGEPQFAAHPEYTDWQSAAGGGTIPEWVTAVLNVDSEDTVRSLLKKPTGYRIWSLNNQGVDIDALKLLTDNFEIQTQVSNSISQNAADFAIRIQEAEGTTDKAKIKEQTARVLQLISSNLTLNGLERITSYWVKYYMADKKGRPVEGDTGKERYSYIVVMGMEGERFNAQLDAAMKKINENTSEDEYLRKLTNKVIEEFKAQISGHSK